MNSVKIDEWDCIKLKIFHTAKEIAEGSGNLENGRKSLPAIHLMGDYYPEYIKHSKKPPKEQMTQLINGQIN
jgi:hypothetical protein